MKAMIFAAGMGTRLKPMTDVMPKALVPVGGIPLLEHVARKLLSAGIDEAVVNVHHFADMIEEWVADQEWICTSPEKKADGRMMIQISDERDALLETGGAVLHAGPYLEGCGHFLIHNVDILSDCDLTWLQDQVRQDSLGTLLVSNRETSRYFLFHPQTMRLVGWMNRKTGECIMKDPALTAGQCRAYAFAGMHVLSEKVLPLMAEYVAETMPGTEGPARFPIVDFYLWAAGNHPLHGVVATDLNLLDVGKIDALDEAERFLSDKV